MENIFLSTKTLWDVQYVCVYTSHLQFCDTASLSAALLPFEITQHWTIVLVPTVRASFFLFFFFFVDRLRFLQLTTQGANSVRNGRRDVLFWRIKGFTYFYICWNLYIFYLELFNDKLGFVNILQDTNVRTFVKMNDYVQLSDFSDSLH